MSAVKPDAAANPVYHAPPAATLLRTRFDILDAVYDRRSALTHLVAEPVPAILDSLAAGPARAAELMRRLSDDYAIEGELAALRARLDELVALGLVEARGR
jgi:PqqD family protein of HPr-rel-A system